MIKWSMKCFATDDVRQSTSDAGNGCHLNAIQTINIHIKMFCFDSKQNRWGFSHAKKGRKDPGDS